MGGGLGKVGRAELPLFVKQTFQARACEGVFFTPFARRARGAPICPGQAELSGPASRGGLSSPQEQEMRTRVRAIPMKRIGTKIGRPNKPSRTSGKELPRERGALRWVVFLPQGWGEGPRAHLQERGNRRAA